MLFQLGKHRLYYNYFQFILSNFQTSINKFIDRTFLNSLINHLTDVSVKIQDHHALMNTYIYSLCLLISYAI